MYSVQKEKLSRGTTLKCKIEANSLPISYENVIQLWQNDDEFREFFMQLPADAPFASYRWETPPITSKTSTRPFEFVIVDSPNLVSSPDQQAFAEYFSNRAPSQNVVAFKNLGKDAILVVPYTLTSKSDYGHLASFIRNAPNLQKHELWKTVGKQISQRVESKPVWLSTAGAGVAWLHVRLDDRPKYYQHAEYRENR